MIQKYKNKIESYRLILLFITKFGITESSKKIPFKEGTEGKNVNITGGILTTQMYFSKSRIVKENFLICEVETFI